MPPFFSGHARAKRDPQRHRDRQEHGCSRRLRHRRGRGYGAVGRGRCQRQIRAAWRVCGRVRHPGGLPGLRNLDARDEAWQGHQLPHRAQPGQPLARERRRDGAGERQLRHHHPHHRPHGAGPRPADECLRHLQPPAGRRDRGAEPDRQQPAEHPFRQVGGRQQRLRYRRRSGRRAPVRQCLFQQYRQWWQCAGRIHQQHCLLQRGVGRGDHRRALRGVRRHVLRRDQDQYPQGQDPLGCDPVHEPAHQAGVREQGLRPGRHPPRSQPGCAERQPGAHPLHFRPDVSVHRLRPQPALDDLERAVHGRDAAAPLAGRDRQPGRPGRQGGSGQARRYLAEPAGQRRPCQPQRQLAAVQVLDYQRRTERFRDLCRQPAAREEAIPFRGQRHLAARTGARLLHGGRLCRRRCESGGAHRSGHALQRPGHR